MPGCGSSRTTRASSSSTSTARLETGANDAIVRRICAQLPCRVGGGVRTIARAEALIAAGAQQVIVSSALFQNGRIDLAFARALATAVGIDRVIAAVDSAGGKVVIRGWTEATALTAVEAVARARSRSAAASSTPTSTPRA